MDRGGDEVRAVENCRISCREQLLSFLAVLVEFRSAFKSVQGDRMKGSFLGANIDV